MSQQLITQLRKDLGLMGLINEYRDGVRKLNPKKPLIITGAAGTGKSILARDIAGAHAGSSGDYRVLSIEHLESPFYNSDFNSNVKVVVFEGLPNTKYQNRALFKLLDASIMVANRKGQKEMYIPQPCVIICVQEGHSLNSLSLIEYDRINLPHKYKEQH